MARYGGARQSAAASCKARYGKDIRARYGLVVCGLAEHGIAWFAVARHGKDNRSGASPGIVRPIRLG